MTALIVDANIAVKWYVEDALSPQARAAAANHVLHAPWLILSEAANALWKYVSRGVISGPDAATALATLPRSIEIAAETDLAPESILLAARLNHPAYDCFYLALAQRMALPLLTADNRLATLAAQVGVSAIRLDSIETEAT